MASENRVRLAPGVSVERLGNECLVYRPAQSEIVSLSGDAAEAVIQISEGQTANIDLALISELESLGVVRSNHGPSRRSVVRAGVIGAGVGVASLSMPSVAVASSPSNGGGDSQTFGILTYRATGSRWEFTPQPFTAITEIQTFISGGGTSILTLESGQTTNTWNNGVEAFLLVGASNLFGTSVTGTWTLGGSTTRTQTFNRSPDLP